MAQLLVDYYGSSGGSDDDMDKLDNEYIVQPHVVSTNVIGTSSGVMSPATSSHTTAPMSEGLKERLMARKKKKMQLMSLPVLNRSDDDDEEEEEEEEEQKKNMNETEKEEEKDYSRNNYDDVAVAADDDDDDGKHIGTASICTEVNEVTEPYTNVPSLKRTSRTLLPHILTKKKKKEHTPSSTTTTTVVSSADTSSTIASPHPHKSILTAVSAAPAVAPESTSSNFGYGMLEADSTLANTNSSMYGYSSMPINVTDVCGPRVASTTTNDELNSRVHDNSSYLAQRGGISGQQQTLVPIDSLEGGSEFARFMGRSARKELGASLAVVDFNESDIISDMERTRAIHANNGGIDAGSMRNLAPTGSTKRTGSLLGLAAQAQNNHKILEAQWAANKEARKAAKSRYGF